MRRIGRARTAPEEKVAALLRAMKVGYRRNVRGLPGTPDFANRSRRWAIFVMGCYWHHHTNCAHATVPRRNREFWQTKFVANRKRDAAKIKALRARGMKVVVIWECQTRNAVDSLTKRLSHLLKA